MVDVSIAGAFLAGLVSFLSPCVLPLVPGYLSMLSGIGVEQLRRGEQPRSSLLASSLAFVGGFSVVFITFGASASAVGQFLVRNRNLLAPIAGALIVLFGLHLIGLLAKISIRAGLIVGAILAAGAGLLFARPGLTGGSFGALQILAVSMIFFLGPVLTRWLNRDVHFRNLGGQPGAWSGFFFSSRRLFRRTGHPVCPDGTGAEPLPAFLPALPKVPSRRRSIERRAAAACRGIGVYESPDLAFGQAGLFEWRGAVAGKGAHQQNVASAFARG